MQFLRALWFALHERVSSLDELDMCTTRLRLQLPGEPSTDNIHVIHPLQASTVASESALTLVKYFRRKQISFVEVVAVMRVNAPLF